MDLSGSSLETINDNMEDYNFTSISRKELWYLKECGKKFESFIKDVKKAVIDAALDGKLCIEVKCPTDLTYKEEPYLIAYFKRVFIDCGVGFDMDHMPEPKRVIRVIWK